MGEEHTTLTSTDGEPTSGYWYTRGAREIEPVDVLNLLRRYREHRWRRRWRLWSWPSDPPPESYEAARRTLPPCIRL